MLKEIAALDSALPSVSGNKTDAEKIEELTDALYRLTKSLQIILEQMAQTMKKMEAGK